MDLKHIDLVKIELNSGTIHRSFLSHSIGLNDENANAFGVSVYRDGEPVNLGGAAIQGFFKNPQGENIAITTGNYISGNVAYVVLPQACYNYDGQFALSIKLIGDGVTGTMRIVDGMVDNTNTGGAVAPVADIPTYQEILAVYQQMLEAKAGAIRYDIEQELTSAQRDQARDNIGMVSIEFTQIEGNEYLMTVSTKCEFVNVTGDEYMLVLHAD